MLNTLISLGSPESEMSNLLLLLINCASAVTYQPLQNKEWTNCQSSYFEVNTAQKQYLINYQYCFITTEISFDFIQKEIVKDTGYVLNYAESLGLKNQECIANSNLEIFQVDLKTLNSTKFQDQSVTPGGQTWGLYDPRVNDYNVSSIILTEHGYNMDRVIFAHELSHYWYDRLCWSSGWTKTPEQFALGFEDYLSRKELLK